MLSPYDIIDILDDIETDPYVILFGCVICVREGCREDEDGISFSDVFHAGVDHVFYLQAKLWREDIVTGKMGWGYGGKSLLSPHMTKGEVVKLPFTLALSFAQHEVRERFRYRGRKVLGPHISIDSLWEVAEDYEVRNAPAG